MTKYTEKNTENFLRHEKSRRERNEVSKKYLKSFSVEIENGRFQLEEVVNCICCNGKTFITVSTIDRFDLKFGNILCQECGLLSTSPRLSETDLQYYYSKYYHPLTFGVEHIGDQKQLFAEGQGEKIFGILDPYMDIKDLRVLEIGVGVGDVITGFIAADSKRTYSLAVGTEFSKECLDISKEVSENQSVDVKFIQGGFSEAKDLSKSYDVIILSHVFEHIPDLNEALNQISGLLSEGGLLYIEVPGLFVNHMIPYYNYSFIDYTIHAHMYNFCAQTLLNVISKHKFDCVSINEKVEAIFRRSEEVSSKPTINVSDQSLFYLNLIGAPEYSSFHEKRDFEVKQLKAAIITKDNVQKGLIDKIRDLEVQYEEVLLSKNKAEQAHSDELRSKLAEEKKSTLIHHQQSKIIEEMQAKLKLSETNHINELESKLKLEESLDKIIERVELVGGANLITSPRKKFINYKLLMKSIKDKDI